MDENRVVAIVDVYEKSGEGWGVDPFPRTHVCTV
jgi:hypothetical protein